MVLQTTVVPDKTSGTSSQYTGRLKTNAGIHKEAYFRASGKTGREESAGLWEILQTENNANSPAAVAAANELWTNWRTSKGMIVTDSTLSASIIPTEEDATTFYSPDYNFFDVQHGFSFHYNPTAVSMSYGVRNDIDPNQYIAGTEVFNSFTSMSPVVFKLIINRVFDMKYINGYTGKLLPGVSAKDFAGRAPDENDIKDIWNKGTMYDIEYLLRVITGFAIQARLTSRNMSSDGKTSDIGFITGTPCELHLGQSMRYLGRITSLGIRHVLFNERMVPTFSEVDISFQRIPDTGSGTGATDMTNYYENQATLSDAYSRANQDKQTMQYSRGYFTGAGDQLPPYLKPTTETDRRAAAQRTGN